MLLIQILGNVNTPEECAMECKGNVALRIGLMLEKKWNSKQGLKNENGDDMIKCYRKRSAAMATYFFLDFLTRQ